MERPICELQSGVATIGEATRVIYDAEDCPGCLLRAIGEAEERTRVLRELLAKVETLS
jgi:hypothetical protein